MVDKPSKREDEYFARLEFERKKEDQEKIQNEMKKKERERLKELHYMHCPKCGMRLIEIDYQHLKIDRCSHCDGVWLDAGELDEVLKTKGTEFLGFLKLFKK
jgi:hypothetical protein